MTMPRIPSSAIPSIAPMSSRWAMSFSTATGSTRSSTKARTVSWISRCSSVSSKFTPRSLARDGRALIRHPHADEAPVVGDEMLVLVLRERPLHGLHEQIVERLAPDELERRLVEVGEMLGTELAVVVDVEVVLRQGAVPVELLRVREVVAVADLEVGARVLVDSHPPPDDGAEHRPADEGCDCPRKVVVQRRERDVGRRVRVVDRV